jgi:tungstate transport system substrate-binding protein
MILWMRIWPGAIFVVAFGLVAVSCGDDDKSLVLGATTSVQDSGLLDEVIQAFEAETNYEVTPVVGGSGQIMETARKGEFDVIITHSPVDEERFITDGEGVDRRPFMENYYLLAGPPADPAAVAVTATLTKAFSRLASREAEFLSRGDNSGTHVRELAIWEEAGVDPVGESWYRESAVGQGQNLLVASEKGAYTLVDSSTFVAFRDKVELREYVVDRQEPNVYSAIRVNPEKHAGVNSAAAIAFVDFLRSLAGQCLIDEFGRTEYGESLFSATCLRSDTGG